MSDKPEPKVCHGCGHPFHPAGNCRALEAGRCPCERNMAIVLQTDVGRPDPHYAPGARALNAALNELERLRAALEKVLAHSMHQNAVEQIVRETLWPT